MSTRDDLAAYLGTGSLPEAEADQVLDAANALIDAALGADTAPATVRNQAQVIVAAELWRRRDAPGGVVNAWGDTSTPIRLARDPLTPALPLLKPWMSPVIA